MTFSEFFESGMNVGRDVMGMMANTLVLVYVGSSMAMFLLFLAKDASLVRILNFNFVASEFLRAMCSSIGLVLTIPTTAFLGSYLLSRKVRIPFLTQKSELAKND